MKKSILVLTATVAMVLFGCKEDPYINAPGNNSFNSDSIPVVVDPVPTPDPEGIEIPEGAISVNEAVNIAKKLPNKCVSEQKYFIKGWVVSFGRGETFDTDFPKYGNDFVYLSSRQDGEGEKQFYAYRLLGKFGAKFPDLECVEYGDFIVISCYITNYGGVYESSGSCFAYSSSNPHFDEVFPEFPGCPEPKEGELSVTDAEAVALTLESKATSEESYKVRGVVTSIDVVDPSYGNATFNISDGLSYATCYRLKAKDNASFTNANQVALGDTVLVYAKIQNYNGTCEPTQGYVAESTNPNFQEAFKPGDTIYATCAEAKAIAFALPTNNTPTKDIYVIEGYVQQDGYNATVSRGQQVFWIADTQTGGKVFESYYCNVPGGNAVPVGAKVRLTGPIMKYNTTAEMKNGNVEVIE